VSRSQPLERFVSAFVSFHSTFTDTILDKSTRTGLAGQNRRPVWPSQAPDQAQALETASEAR